MMRAVQVALLLLAAATLAQPAVVDFTGVYDPSMWTLTNPVGGSLDTTGAPASVTLTGGDSDIAGYITWTIAAPGAGTVSFDWSYVSYDIDDPSYDPAGWVLNGVYNQLTDDNGANTQSGSANFSVTAGDTFGFYVYTGDGMFGPGQITLSNFSAPDGDSAIPEPATWLLVSVPLVLAGLRRRRRA